MKIKRFINIVIFIFIFALYFFTFLMIYDNFRERKLNSLEKSALELFENKIETKKDEIIPENITPTVNYNGYTILGRIQIPRIGFSSVILKEQTYEAMNIGTIKSYGVDLNEPGGFVVSGHNFRGRNRFFYSILNLKSGDKVNITDASGKYMEYTVYEVDRYVSPNDTSYLSYFDGYHVTLVTCENGGKSRIVVKARVQ